MLATGRKISYKPTTGYGVASLFDALHYSPIKKSWLWLMLWAACQSFSHQLRTCRLQRWGSLGEFHRLGMAAGPLQSHHSAEMKIDLPGLGKQSPHPHPWIGTRSSWQASKALALKLHLNSLVAASNEHQGSSFLSEWSSGLDLYAQHFTLSTEKTVLYVLILFGINRSYENLIAKESWIYWLASDFWEELEILDIQRAAFFFP